MSDSSEESSMAIQHDMNTNTTNCRVCGVELGAGYLCDDCDIVEGWPDV